MQLKKDKVATLNYTLSDDEGNTIDESNDGSFAYLHGNRNIIPGLENALDGKGEGETVKVVIEPEEAYGERDLERIQKVPKDMFPPDVVVKPGMQFRAQAQQGGDVVVTVTAVDPEAVTVDANHPLAGKRLHFEATVVEVREASEEELQEGRVQQA